jgi:hypothetical protein
MKNIFIVFLVMVCYLYPAATVAQIGKVGINTSSPQAMLHVKDSNVLFSGVSGFLPGSPGNPPVSGAGVRMMWYPDKAAFRAGYVFDANWDRDSIGQYSFASGYNPMAKGYASISFGFNSRSTDSYAIAVGADANASSNSAAAFGTFARAGGPGSTAVGNSTQATGQLAMAAGIGSIASGTESMALGYLTEASGIRSTSMGSGSLASGSYSFALGRVTRSLGNYSFSAGRNSVASGDYATAFGDTVTARSFNSFTIGRYNDSLASSTPDSWINTDPIFIIGNGTADNARSNAFLIAKNGHTGINIANGMPQALLHVRKDGVSGGPFSSSAGIIFESNGSSYIQLSHPTASETGILSGNGLTNIRSAIVFNSDSSIDFRTGGNTDRLIISKTGNAGLNISSSQALLHLKGTLPSSFDSHIRLESAGASTDYMNMVYDGHTKFRNFGAGDEYQWRNAANTIIMRLEENGNLTITGIYSPSDTRLKKNISPLQNSLQKITALGGYKYNWIDKTNDNSLQTGLLAQQVEKQMPELVKTDADGVKSVNYHGMIPYLIEAIKELKRENEVLKKEIDYLRGKFQ